MKLTAFLPLALCACFYACDNSSKPSAVDPDDEPVVSSSSAVAVDYSKGRAMNKRLGKGINLGNSWDSNGSGADGDCGWNNCIKDEYFVIIAKAGFNSIRLPVRWQTDSDYGSHTVDPDKLEGVKEDVRLATKNGLAVILDFHHYTELFEYGSDFAKGDSLAGVKFYKEKDHFIAMWAQVAKEFDKEFPDSLLVFDVMNEPTISNADLVNDLTMSAYEVIRQNAPGKTIMFEAYHAAKFIDLAVLKLPCNFLEFLVIGHLITETGKHILVCQLVHPDDLILRQGQCALRRKDLGHIAADVVRQLHDAVAQCLNLVA